MLFGIQFGNSIFALLIKLTAEKFDLNNLSLYSIYFDNFPILYSSIICFDMFIILIKGFLVKFNFSFSIKSSSTILIQFKHGQFIFFVHSTFNKSFLIVIIFSFILSSI